MILAIGIIIVVGFLGGWLTEKGKFPRVTGYIIIGVLMSPSLLNIISETNIENLDIMTNIALGVIAFLIGGNLDLGTLKKLGKSIAWITPFESLSAWIVVTILLVFLAPLVAPMANATLSQTYLPIALIIGAVSCATAPAATMAIIQECKASGPLTTTLLAVVAIDDAIAVILFSIALSISQSLIGIGGISLYASLGLPFLHIAGAIVIGALSGFTLIYIAKLAKSPDLLLVIIVGMIMLCSGIAIFFDISVILANMVAGSVVINRMGKEEMFLVVGRIENIIYGIFFVLAGLHFDLSVMKAAGLLAVIITLGRILGKYFGARTGASISNASAAVKQYLGFALLPTAGVAIGLALVAKSALPTIGVVLLNTVLTSVIINEIIAPPFTKFALMKAGEANIDPGG